MKVEKLHIDDHEEQVKDVVMLAARICLKRVRKEHGRKTQ